MVSTIQLKRGASAQQWEESAVILAPGEPGVALDTGEVRFGNGVDRWRSLPAQTKPSPLDAATYSIKRETASQPDYPYTFDYYVLRFKTQGRFGRVIDKVYADNWDGTGNPPKEALTSYQDRLGTGVVVNADAWADAGPITGCQIQNGKIVHDFSGTPKGRHCIGIRDDGWMKVYDQEDGWTAESVLADGVVNTFVFGPPLVENGVQLDMNEEMPESVWGGPWGRRARTILGQAENGDVIIILVPEERGGVYYETGAGGVELNKLAYDLGCYQALLLDGGGSTQALIDGSTRVESSAAAAPRPVVSVMSINAIATADNDRAIAGRFTRDAAFSLPSGAYTQVPMTMIDDGNMTIDGDGLPVITAAGYYQVSGWFEFANGAALPSGDGWMRLQKNNTSLVRSSVNRTASASAVVALRPGDTVSLFVYQNSGAAVNSGYNRERVGVSVALIERLPG